ncbi:MAG: MerR family transcriptional regulator [Chitinophagales bacterium]|nr:MerR family transcriptional regulator [Chitinophagales bacterium]
MTTYSIKELAALSGIKPHTIRIWEQRYGIIEPDRTETNIRTYSDEQLRFILNVSFLNNNGYKISAIAKMKPEDVVEQVNRLSHSNFEYETQIQALNIAMVELDEKRFEKIISTNIIQYGFEHTMINIIFPFMDQVGRLWVTGAINPAHEHFITNLVRQKLIVAIDGTIVNENENTKTILLFLPENENHELGLLFTYYMFKKRNHHVVYLGASVPYADLKVISKIQKPDALFTIMTLKQMDQSEEDYVDNLSKQFADCKIFVTGLVGKQLDENRWGNVHVLTTMEDSLKLLDKMNGLETKVIN